MTVGQATPTQDTAGTRSVPAQLAPDPLGESAESIDQSLEKALQNAGATEGTLGGAAEGQASVAATPATGATEGQQAVQPTGVDQGAALPEPAAAPEPGLTPEQAVGAGEPSGPSVSPILDALTAAGQTHDYPDEASAIRGFTELRQKLGERDQEVENWRAVEPVMRDPAFQEWYRQRHVAAAAAPGATQPEAVPGEAQPAETAEPDYGYDFGPEYDPDLEARIKPELDPDTGEPTGKFTGGTPEQLQQVTDRWGRVNTQWRDWQNEPRWLVDDLVIPAVEQKLREYDQRVHGQQQNQAALQQVFQANQHIFLDRTNPQQLGFSALGRAFVDMVSQDGLAPETALARLGPVIQASGVQPVGLSAPAALPGVFPATSTPAPNPSPQVPGSVPAQPATVQPGGMVTPAGSSAAVVAGAGQVSPQTASRRPTAPRAEQRDYKQLGLDELTDLTALEGGIDVNAMPV